MKKILIITIIVISGIIGVTKYNQYKNSTHYKLKEKGYNKEEIEQIINLENKQVNLIKEKDHIENITSFLNEKFFIETKLDEYLEYQENNEESNLENIISVVNAGANKEFYSETKKADISKENLMLVNKFHYLDEDFKFDDIVPISTQYAYANHSAREEVRDKYISMWHAAKKEGLTLIVTSSYRDYELQNNLYINYKNIHGEEAADTFSAKPGYSEHQTGLALDIVTYGSELNEDFSETDEYKWLQENAYKYGFIERYPLGKEHITGYKFEPWHYRYVGKEVATKIKELNITFDEYYHLFIK